MWSNTYLVFSWQDVFQAGGVLGKRALKQQMTSVIGPPPFLRTYTPLKTTYCPCINKTENGDPWHMCVAKTNQPSPTAGSSPQILFYWIQLQRHRLTFLCHAREAIISRSGRLTIYNSSAFETYSSYSAKSLGKSLTESDKLPWHILFFFRLSYCCSDFFNGLLSLSKKGV